MKYFGKFRGTVVDNVDPLQLARIRAEVPDVLGGPASPWAMPCLPFAGRQCGFYAVPPVGAGVWVEFEGGDPDFPIWTGCFWRSAAEVPTTALTSLPGMQTVVVQTAGQSFIQVSDAAEGGITLSTETGARITMDQAGVAISNGQGASIVLTGPIVSINDGALAIT